MLPLLVVCNPAAGRGRVMRRWPEVQRALQATGIPFDLAMTTAPGDAMLRARGAVDRYRGIVAVGGDGTVHEVVNGLVQATGDEAPTLPLAVVPLGSGDDFAKVIPPQAAVGGKSFGWQTAIEKVVANQTRQFDLGRMQGWRDRQGQISAASTHYFMNGMDVGFGAHGNRNMASVPSFLKGYVAYLAAIMKTLINYPLLPLRLQLDDEEPFDFATSMTAITNGRCFGSGFWVCPDARPDDGMLDLMLVQEVSRMTILRLIPKISQGRHGGEPVLRLRQARRVLLQSDEPFAVEADGEMPFDAICRLQVDVLPGRLTLFV